MPGLITQFYRWDDVRDGKANLTITTPEGKCIEQRRMNLKDLYAYRQTKYPDAHNERAHKYGGGGCLVCERED
jgi:hypothetical protein